MHLGTAAYPQRDTLSARLGWTGRRAASLRVSVLLTDRWGRTVSGAAKLSASHVTVPPGGTAFVTLQVDPVKLAGRPGLYAAEVTARGGGVTARTLATFYVEPPSYTLTIKSTPLPGTPAGRTSLSHVSVVNVDDVALFWEGFESVPEGTIRLRVPHGRYAVLGAVSDTTDQPRAALAGAPEVMVDRDVTVTLDGAKAKPVTASVQGRSTTAAVVSAVYARQTRQELWADSMYGSDPVRQPVLVQPTSGVRTGTFRTYGVHRLTAPGTVWDLIHRMGDRFPAEPSYVVTPAEQARAARVDQRFAAFDEDTTKPVGEKRYGTTPEGLLVHEASSKAPAASTRTDYLSTGRGIYWIDEAFPEAIEGWVDQEPPTEREPGSRVTKTWGRQPLRPGPYSDTSPAASSCTPYATTRARGHLHVELVDLQTRTDGFHCPLDRDPIKRKLVLYAGATKLGERGGAKADFPIPAKAATYRLRYYNDASKLLPVSTRTSTTWTFRSATPEGHASTRIPLLTVDYDLRFGLRNEHVGEPAVFTVARVKGSGTAHVTSLRLWTSMDDGKTWRPVTVRALGGGRFSAPLPAAPGQAVSLRVSAQDHGGSGIDQTIIRAYRGH